MVGCPIAVGVAAGVTEGITVQEIKDDFDDGINKVDQMLTSINSLGQTTTQLVSKVQSDNTKMTHLHRLLDESRLQADVVSSGEFAFIAFFDLFKASVSKLQESCASYLGEDVVDMAGLAAKILAIQKNFIKNLFPF